VAEIPTKYNDLHCFADCVDRFIWVFKHTDWMHIVAVRAIIRQENVVQQNFASDRINSIWLVNYHLDLDTYWTVYSVTMPESLCEGGR